MFNVCSERCGQCLFSKEKIVSAARAKEILRECRRENKHFICHKTENVCCRGFYDTQTSQLMRIAQRLGMVKFVDIAKDQS